jgi:hypothetical protein
MRRPKKLETHDRAKQIYFWPLNTPFSLPAGGACLHRYPKYEAIPVKAGGGWYVVVTSRDGSKQEWFGFVTEPQARAWITKEMYASATPRPLRN